jgi:O-antigen/teichoic acid export membrane protein
MNPKTLVKISNSIGVISIILLIYWVFSFISIQVFGLKVFRENITESFYFSIIGILALMTGALIINLMFNLTRIAEKHNDDKSLNKKISKRVLIIFLLSFPILFGVLFTGDYLTSQKKEKMLINSANRIISENSNKADKIVDYNFDNNLKLIDYKLKMHIKNC